MLHLLNGLYWLNSCPRCNCPSMCCHFLMQDLHHLLRCLYNWLCRLHRRPGGWQNKLFDHYQILTLIIMMLLGPLVTWESIYNDFLLLGVTHGHWGSDPCSPWLALWRWWQPRLRSWVH